MAKGNKNPFGHHIRHDDIKDPDLKYSHGDLPGGFPIMGAIYIILCIVIIGMVILVIRDLQEIPTCINSFCF